MTNLQVTWFILIGVLLLGYTILDGFDLGVGFWHLFTKNNEQRKFHLHVIGPFWDGNEVWLLTGGGAIFAAFPHVYATVFSGFYLALILLLVALIFRAVSIEFRDQEDNTTWKKLWDYAFAWGSILPALLFGVALGNILRGISLDSSMNYTGSFFDLLNPYALLIGLTGLTMIATHGALFLGIKAEQQQAQQAIRNGFFSWGLYFVLFTMASIITFIYQPQLLNNFKSYPVLWIVPVLAFLCILGTGFFLKRQQARLGFISSSLGISSLWGIVGISIFPTIVPALNNPELSLTIMNASSSPLTLKTMFIIAIIGMPIVIGYTIWMYLLMAKNKTVSDIY